jgi:hypothetical protein
LVKNENLQQTFFNNLSALAKTNADAVIAKAILKTIQ